MEITLELVVVMKFDELKTGPSLTMDDIVDIETRHPIMIGSFAPFGRIEVPAIHRHVKRARASMHARRRAHRRAARKR